MLRARLRADMRVYRDAVDAMDTAAVRGVPIEEFNKIAKHAAHAMQAFTRARERLNRHISQHACE